MFDSRIAYVAETGSGTNLVRRIAMMDSDGFNHDYATMGETMVLSPRLSPRARSVAFVSFSGGSPHIRLLDLETRKTNRSSLAIDQLSRVSRLRAENRSPDQGLCDIYVADAAGGPQSADDGPASTRGRLIDRREEHLRKRPIGDPALK